MGLNFIMEDYSTGVIDDIEIVKQRIWDSKYSFKKIYTNIEFEPRLSELGNSIELYDLFDKYKSIPCTHVKSNYNDENMTSYDFIRIHINNTWAYVCEKDCYLPKEYHRRLYFAKELYFDTIKNITCANADTLKHALESNYKEAERIKLFANNRKMNLSWDEYVEKVNSYLDKIAVNFKPIDVYEDENPENDIDFENLIGYTDDNYAVGYINKSLTGYFRNDYIINMNLPIGKNYKYKECCNCGKLILKEYRKSTKYCKVCAKIIKQNQVNECRRNKRSNRINH